jgi:hypothetical protein
MLPAPQAPEKLIQVGTLTAVTQCTGERSMHFSMRLVLHEVDELQALSIRQSRTVRIRSIRHSYLPSQDCMTYGSGLRCPGYQGHREISA